MPSTEIGSREHLDSVWNMTEQGAGICVGYALPGVELKIIDIVDGPIDSIEEASELPTGGQVGEILVRGQAREPRVLPRPREHAEEQGARPTRGPGSALGMSATWTRRASSGSAVGCRSG